MREPAPSLPSHFSLRGMMRRVYTLRGLEDDVVVQVVRDLRHPEGSPLGHPGWVTLSPSPDELSVRGSGNEPLFRHRWTHELALASLREGEIPWHQACFPDRNTAILALARAREVEVFHGADEISPVPEHDEPHTELDTAVYCTCMVAPGGVRREAFDLEQGAADEVARRWIATFAGATIVRVGKRIDGEIEVAYELWAPDMSRHDHGAVWPDAWGDPWRRRWFLDRELPPAPVESPPTDDAQLGFGF